MKTTSVKLRRQILVAYDNREGTRAQVAMRFGVSLGMVKKLLQQRRRTADLAPRHRYSGRKPLLTAEHHRELRRLLRFHPDMTLAELRRTLRLPCSLSTIHNALAGMGPAFKTRRLRSGK